MFGPLQAQWSHDFSIGEVSDQKDIFRTNVLECSPVPTLRLCQTNISMMYHAAPCTSKVTVKKMLIPSYILYNISTWMIKY